MSTWIECAKQTPPPGIPVWLHEPGKASPWIGCYEYANDDPGVGWVYTNCYGSQHWDQNLERWVAFDSGWDDEYKPTHWLALPEPPKGA